MVESGKRVSYRTNRAQSSWIEYLAALWAFVFALLHVAWAFGWYIGLDEGMAREAFARGWFLA